MAKKQEEPNESTSPVTVYMPDSLIKRIDEAATKERRQRSPQIVVLVEEAFAVREEMASAK